MVEQGRAREMKLTDRANLTINLASQEAKRLQHPFVGRGHLLLGIVMEGNGLAAKVLLNLGVDLESLRQEVGSLTPTTSDEIEQTVLHAAAHALSLNHYYIGTEHLLMDLFPDSPKPQEDPLTTLVKEKFALTPAKIRQETERIFAKGFYSKPIPPEKWVDPDEIITLQAVHKFLEQLPQIRRNVRVEEIIAWLKKAAEEEHEHLQITHPTSNNPSHLGGGFVATPRGRNSHL